MFRVSLALLLASSPAAGRTLAELEASGFLIERALPVDGDFRGCDPLHPIRLGDGADFLCQTRSFTYLRHPLAFVLRDPVTEETVLLIGGEEYVGRLEGVARLGRRVETGTGPLVDVPQTVPVRLAPNEPDAGTSTVSSLSGIEQPPLPGHDSGEPRQ